MASVAAYDSAEVAVGSESGCSAEYVVAGGIAGYVVDASDGCSDDGSAVYAAASSNRRIALAAAYSLTPMT